MSEIVIVKGMKPEWFRDHFRDMVVSFGSDQGDVPTRDAHYIGFYLEAPVAAITHLGIVEKVERAASSVALHLKAVIKLDAPVRAGDAQAVRQQVYWALSGLGIKHVALVLNDFIRVDL